MDRSVSAAWPVRWRAQVGYLSVGRNSRTCPRMLQTSVSGPRRDIPGSRHSLADCAIAFGSGSVGVKANSSCLLLEPVLPVSPRGNAAAAAYLLGNIVL